MNQGRAEHCRSACRRRHAGDHLDFHLRIVHADLQHQAGHAVNAGVSAADHRHGLSFFRLLEGQDAAVHFLSHGSGEEFLVCKMRLHQIHINRITNDRIAG